MKSASSNLVTTRPSQLASGVELPPLRWFLETPDLKPAAIVLAQHPTRRLLAGAPLPVITMQFAGAGKVLFHATDETYLWSRGREADKLYARYWGQAIRYLSHAKLNADQVTCRNRNGFATVSRRRKRTPASPLPG